jgi:methylenetetrahydrofolate--tRNA-(uracil-5-)-methyltransferase
MAGVEGYVESAALGLVAGINAARAERGEPVCLPGDATALGALLRHLREADPARFQPMNVNFGLFPPLADAPRKLRKPDKQARLVARAQAALADYVGAVGEGGP